MGGLCKLAEQYFSLFSSSAESIYPFAANTAV